MITQHQFTEQLKTLVAFQTLSGNADENTKALDYVQQLLTPQARCRRIKNKSAEILLASNGDPLHPDIGYIVHIDVVSAAPALFSMKQKGGKLYGRGVSDMKFSIPLGVALVNELIATKSSRSFCLAITTDEEVGGYDGATYLATDLEWKPKVLIVPDGGDNMCFVDKSKGVCQLSVTATGVSSHASRPWDGKNALVPLAQLITELNNRYGEHNTKEGWNTTVNFGKLHGGTSANQVCDHAVVTLDFRYPETDSIERITSEVKELLQRIDPTMTLETGATGLPTFTDIKLPVVQEFLACMETEFRKPIRVSPTYGASDARHFATQNIPILMMKPMGGDIHCETEWIDIHSTFTFYAGLRRFVHLV